MDIATLPNETTAQRNAPIMRQLADDIEAGKVSLVTINIKEDDRRFIADGQRHSEPVTEKRSMLIHLEQYALSA